MVENGLRSFIGIRSFSIILYKKPNKSIGECQPSYSLAIHSVYSLCQKADIYLTAVNGLVATAFSNSFKCQQQIILA